MPPSTSIVEFREALHRRRWTFRCFRYSVFAASRIETDRFMSDIGIPTFRDSGGYWKNFDLNSIATPQSFQTNPNSVWQFYLDRYAE